MKVFKRPGFLGWIFLFALLLRVLPAVSQTTAAPLITQQVDNTVRTTMHGSTHPAIRTATDEGSLSPSEPVNRMVMVLQPTTAQDSALKALVTQQQMKGSASYHKWLTPTQFATQFGPAQADVQTVSTWLEQQGFNNVKAAQGGRWIEFSGTASTVENAFQTAMHKYQVKTATGTEEHIANATDISIPQALTPAVRGVLSLNNFVSKPQHSTPQLLQKNSAGKLARVSSDTTSGNMSSTNGYGAYTYFLAPADVQQIYNATSLVSSGVDGTGVSIAVIGRTDIQLTDVQTFRTIFGLPQNDPNIIVSGPDPGFADGGDQTESSLDVEWAGAIAQKATINFVIAASTDTTDGIFLAAAYAVENRVSPIITVSYGECEDLLGSSGNQFLNGLWEQAAAEGISVFVSSGDSGAAMCDGNVGTYGPAVYGLTVSGTASTPYNVAVGGTQFNEGGLGAQFWNGNNNPVTQESAYGYIPEAAWSESCDPSLPNTFGNCPYGMTSYSIGGGGGGISSCSQSTVDAQGNVTCTGGYAKPSWQTGPGVPKDGVRDVPDVALNASPEDDPYMICAEGSCVYQTTASGINLTDVTAVGGTSASAPTMASIMALVEQKNGTYQGLPNGVFYQLAAQQTTASCNSTNRTSPTQPSSCIFNDVTSGNNSAPGLPGYGTATATYTTTAGYDLATGLGSVNVSNLVAQWSSGLASTPSVTQLTTGATTAQHGTAIPVTVAVTGSGGTPTGDVSLLTDKYGAQGVYTLDGTGKVVAPVSSLPGGTYNLTAQYAGDGTFGTSTSSPIALTIAPEASVTTMSVESLTSQDTLAPISGPQAFGLALYFRVQVAGASGQGTPTGTITVSSGGTVVASSTLTSQGSALLSSVALPVGTDVLTVSYSGDNSFKASTGTPYTLTMTKGPSVTSAGTQGINVVGQPSVLLGLVSVPDQVVPTGRMQFFDNGVAISPQLAMTSNGPLGPGDGQVFYKYTYQDTNLHILTVSYSGDANYQSVSQNSQNSNSQQVYIQASKGAATTTTFTMTSPATLQLGQSITYTVAVTPTTASATPPTGTVFLFGNGNQPLSSVTLVNGKGAFTSYMQAAGTFTLSAEYTGDTNYMASTSPTKGSLTVLKATPQVSFTTTSPTVLTGTQTSLSVNIAGYPLNQLATAPVMGTVTIMDSVNGGAAQAIDTATLGPMNGGVASGFSFRSVLTAGTNVLTAVYGGAANFNPVTTAAQTVLVGSPDFSVAPSSPKTTLTAGTTATPTLLVEPLLGFTGQVALSCGTGVPTGATCAVSPGSIALGAGQAVTVSLSLPAASPSPASTAVAQGRGGVWPFAAGGGLALAVMFVPVRRRRWLGGSLVALLLLIPAAMTVGCGGGNSTPKATLLSLTSSNTKAASGSEVRFSVQLDALANQPTGTVTFYDGGTSIGSATVTNETAQFQTSGLAVGAHTITAVYGGDDNNVRSTSTGITQVITGSTTLQVNAVSGILAHPSQIAVTVN